MAQPPNALLSTTIKRAADLLGTDPAAAEQQARAALSLAPHDPRPALILASALRRRGDPSGALAILHPLARSYPRAALTQYELGLALAATGSDAEAIAALRRAAGLDPSLADAFKSLGEMLFKKGDRRGSEAAFAHHRTLLLKDPRLKPAAKALHEDRHAEAEAILRRAAAEKPLDAEGLDLLAEVLIGLSRYAEAEGLLAPLAVGPAPPNGTAFNYALALFHQQKGAEALGVLERLNAASPGDPAYGNLTAACLELVGRFEEAALLYEALIQRYEGQPLLWLNYGHILRTVGRRPEAAAAFRRAAALDPSLGEAYLSLANLEPGALATEDALAMRTALKAANLSSRDRGNLFFALGRAEEEAGEHQKAFEAYAAGAAVRRKETPYDPSAFSAYVDDCIARWTPEFFMARRAFGAATDDPIFIVGLHRSGSTLVEQILASHSKVEGTMELPNLGLIARSIGWREPTAAFGVPRDWLGAMDAPQSRALGERYIEETKIHRVLGRAFFTDKMPNNFQMIGLIQLILPRAKIIDARRHPLGACLSGFKQHFAEAQAFTYDLADLGRYYRDYVRFMDHIDQVLPGRVKRVIYEDLIEDTEAEVRRLLDHCGLEFEEGCMRFHDNARPVRTVSSEQVRRPIYRDGVELWRRYEPWLGPLKDALGPALEGWRGLEL